MAWRLAKSLGVLSKEIKSRYPKTTIWSIGDKDHQDDWSDHNPNSKGVVCAIDILSNGGMSLGFFVGFITGEGAHPNLRYVIYQDKIYERSNNFEPKNYRGAYHSHVHVSVGNGPDGRSTRDYDSTEPWDYASVTPPSNPKPPTTPNEGWFESLMSDLPELSKGSKGLYVNRHQALLNIAGARLVEDGDFGPVTERETEEFQRKYGLVPDGIVGPKTWTKELTWK